MRRGAFLSAALAGALVPAVLLGACGGGKAATSAADATAPSATAPAADTGKPAPSATEAVTPSGKTRADCPKIPESTVDVPPLDAGVMSNAQPDAAHDRNATDLNAIVQRHRDRFRCCYDVAQAAHPGIAGEFVLDFTLNPDGSLKTASHNKDRSAIKDDGMGECALDVLKSITFPASKKGKETSVSYPFGFKPKGGSR
jgi:hypothetical protein